MTLDWPFLLPLIFAGLMGLSILIYVILDGFDLGIGILFAMAAAPVLPPFAGEGDRAKRGEGGVLASPIFRVKEGDQP
jgi:hypothetical protein